MRILIAPTDQTYLGPARDLVGAGEAESGVPLSETLRQALSLAIARAMRRPVDPDRLTVRLALAREIGRREAALTVAEDCLLSLGLFPERVRRVGSVRSYVQVGQTAYRAADQIEPAFGFSSMLEVLRFLSTPAPERLLTLARDGSAVAAKRLRSEGIHVLLRA